MRKSAFVIHEQNVKLEESLYNTNAFVDAHEQNTVLGESLLEMNKRFETVCDNTGLQTKIGVLEADNRKLSSTVEMMQFRMDSMDENVMRNITVTGDMGDSIRETDKKVSHNTTALIVLREETRYLRVDVDETRESASKISKRVERNHDVMIEIADIYYQFIIGNTNAHDVKKKLKNKGYISERHVHESV